MKRFIFIALILTCLSGNQHLTAQNAKSGEDYIKAALLNSPLLYDYENRRLSLKFDSALLMADYGLKVDAFADLMAAPVIHGWGYDEALSNGQFATTGLRVSRDIIGRNNLKSRLDSYKLSENQLNSQKQLSEQMMRLTVTDQYINTYISQEQLSIYQEIINVLKKEEKILYKLTQSAVFSQTEYLTFLVSLQQNELSLQQAKADFQNNMSVLNVISGLMDTTTYSLSPPLMDEKMAVPFNESIYAQLNQSDSLKLENEAIIIKNEYKPKLSVYADAGYSSSFIKSPYKNFGTSVGLNLSIPLYDGNKQKMLLQQNSITQDTRSRYYAFNQQQYAQKIYQLNQQIQQTRQMLNTCDEQLKYSDTLIKANLKQLPTGDIRVTDFIVSENNFLNLKLTRIQYEGKLYSYFNQLKYMSISTPAP
ncbi:MAG TPA: TolC family protein [Paludibacteraceae bacterium]|nr:TolC family protein [Paludibacteraceae bacterium]HPT44006.1 TolC family protein [Paludibacteraceae bacterium]